jgi:lipoate-protein ligase B
LYVVDLHRVDFEYCMRLQGEIVTRKVGRTEPDFLIIAEHHPVITFGVRSSESDLLKSPAELIRLGIQLRSVRRGGRTTYHGPGQLQLYPIIDLKRRRLSVRNYVELLQETLIVLLSSLGIEAIQVSRLPGVWIRRGEKIASLGINITRRVTSHGCSLNVLRSSDPTKLVMLCGDRNLKFVYIDDYVKRSGLMSQVRVLAKQAFSEVFNVSLEEASKESLGICDNSICNGVFEQQLVLPG